MYGTYSVVVAIFIYFKYRIIEFPQLSVWYLAEKEQWEDSRTLQIRPIRNGKEWQEYVIVQNHWATSTHPELNWLQKGHRKGL